MRVLMFGWEFPPHISGGLGTACAGLANALDKADVELLFTVPKLNGGEETNRVTFINASSVPIRQTNVFGKRQNESIRQASEKQVDESKFPAGLIHHQSICVPAKLNPYPSGESLSYQLQQWNYTFTDRKDRSLPGNLRTKATLRQSSAEQIRLVKEPFLFSGGYGNNLLEEVNRYAQVGAEIAAANTFDIIHAHDWMTFPAGIEAKKVSGKPLVVHVHATEPDRSGNQVNPEVFAIEKRGMEKADKVVTVSQWTKSIVVERYGIDPSKIEVVHNGITPHRETGSYATVPLNAPVVTFLGRITHQKGPLHFVQAARRVSERFPSAHFVVAGSGDQLPAMIERIAEARLSRRFHFTGFLKGVDVDRVWAMSSVYVMPSVSEPFGIAPLEAIQAGVPVIISKQAGVSEVMPHAIKVDFWNSDALSEAICDVLRFRSLSNTLKKNGAEQIKEITWDKAAKKLTKLYYDLSTKDEKPEKPDPLFSGSSAQMTQFAQVF